MGTVTYTYDDTTNTVTLTNVGTPSTVTWATLRTQDRAAVKSHRLHPNPLDDIWENSPLAAPIAPYLQVRPLDDIALRVKVEVQNFSVVGVMTLTGTDWRGAALSENINITANGIYQTTNYFRTITQISDDGVLTCQWRLWQDRWGLFGYNYGYPSLTTDWIFQGGIIIGADITFTPATTISFSYKLELRPHGADELPSHSIQVNGGGTLLLGRLVDLTSKTTALGVQINIWAYSPSLDEPIFNNGGTIGFYATSMTKIIIRSASGSTTRVWGAQVSEISGFRGEGYDFSNIIYGGLITGSAAFIDAVQYLFSGTVNRVTLLGVPIPVMGSSYQTSDITVSNLYARKNGYAYYHAMGAGTYTVTFINPDLETWNFWWASFDGKVYRKYEFDSHVQDKNGNAISGVSAIGEYISPYGQAFSVTTDANGDIPVQTVDRSWYQRTTGNTENMKTPLKVTYSKAGYKTVIKYYPMNEKVKDRVVLQKVVDIIFVDRKPALNLSETDPDNELYTAI